MKSSGPPDDLKNLFKSSKHRANCAYSQLISRIKPEIEEQQDSSQDDENALSSLKELVVVMPPPPDVQPIVDKMAEYVAKNGKDFEDSIRAKGNMVPKQKVFGASKSTLILGMPPGSRSLSNQGSRMVPAPVCDVLMRDLRPHFSRSEIRFCST